MLLDSFHEAFLSKVGLVTFKWMTRYIARTIEVNFVQLFLH
jgi:hypothetical protein